MRGEERLFAAAQAPGNEHRREERASVGEESERLNDRLGRSPQPLEERDEAHPQDVGVSLHPFARVVDDAVAGEPVLHIPERDEDVIAQPAFLVRVDQTVHKRKQSHCDEDDLGRDGTTGWRRSGHAGSSSETSAGQSSAKVGMFFGAPRCHFAEAAFCSSCPDHHADGHPRSERSHRQSRYVDQSGGLADHVDAGDHRDDEQQRDLDQFLYGARSFFIEILCVTIGG